MIACLQKFFSVVLLEIDEKAKAFMDNGIVFDDRSAILLLLRQGQERQTFRRRKVIYDELSCYCQP